MVLTMVLGLTGSMYESQINGSIVVFQSCDEKFSLKFLILFCLLNLLNLIIQLIEFARK